MSTASELNMESIGEISVSERQRLAEPDGCIRYRSQDLASQSNHRVMLRVSQEQERPADVVTIELTAYHVDNAETGRGFHADVSIALDMSEIRHLHAFLGYLMQFPDVRDDEVSE